MNDMKVSENLKYILTILIALLLLSLPLFSVKAQQNSINAILFFSPSCPHCHKVILEDIPPLLEKFGGQLKIVAVNVSDPHGRDLYLSAVNKYQVPENRLGVPALVIGDNFLVGSVEIPQMLPGLADAGISAGGIPLPSIPGLEDILSSQSDAQSGELIAMLPSEILDTPPAVARIIIEGQILVSEQSAPPESKTTIIEKFKSDLTGNSISVVVLLGMLACFMVVGREAIQKKSPQARNLPLWVIPALATIGLAVSGYLSYVEITQTEAVCGPVGNCNAVQQSVYARLFGVLPIGVLGMTGYAIILIAWAFQVRGTQPQKRITTIGLGAFSLFGFLFSMYLTFLEPFVIGATCAWCLTSAVIMTLIFWASSAPALYTLKGNTNKRKKK